MVQICQLSVSLVECLQQKKIAIGKLEMHQLTFHKKSSNDRSAKCDANETANPEHYIHGVLFDIAICVLIVQIN